METAPFNVTDIVVVLIILTSGVFAFFRGLVHETLAVVSWIGAAVATLIGFPYLQPTAREWVSIPVVADIGTGVVIFLVVLIVLSIITRILANRVRKSGFGPLDRSLGLLFGLLRGGVLICLAWLALAWALPREDLPPWIVEAKTLPLVERGSAALIALVPEHLRGRTAGLLEDTRFEAEQLRRSGDTYRTLVRPEAKDDAPAGQPGYNSRSRDEMQRAIDGITGGEEPSQ